VSRMQRPDIAVERALNIDEDTIFSMLELSIDCGVWRVSVSNVETWSKCDEFGRSLNIHEVKFYERA
jgi:hypothetical protein